MICLSVREIHAFQKSNEPNACVVMQTLSRCFVIALLLKSVMPNCEIEQLLDCTRCCSMLFSTHDCDPDHALRIRINGNGVLGAMVWLFAKNHDLFSSYFISFLQWDNAPVAAIVRDGCLLELWDLRNQTGWYLFHSFRSFTNYSLTIDK